MGTPYVGEIRMFAGNFAPAGWAFCQGQTLPISENEVLFNLIGTTYGGDGQSTFNLPDLQSRVPVHMGTGGGSSTSSRKPAERSQVTLYHCIRSRRTTTRLCATPARAARAVRRTVLWAQQATNSPYSNVAPTFRWRPMPSSPRAVRSRMTTWSHSW